MSPPPQFSHRFTPEERTRITCTKGCSYAGLIVATVLDIIVSQRPEAVNVHILWVVIDVYTEGYKTRQLHKKSYTHFFLGGVGGACTIPPTKLRAGQLFWVWVETNVVQWVEC